MGSWADHQTNGKVTTFYTCYAYGEGVWRTDGSVARVGAGRGRLPRPA
ncbi:hypothetical protein Asera_22980 [Actinocatenispora sera]|uniref:Uncharacterized protein n=1 Tax=Actinocatenispora sera TaxID=390989 RepID=A0A810KY84_9ACTN|nr:hypothetical protein Asera_22980 [Actinocatenispora sera]